MSAAMTQTAPAAPEASPPDPRAVPARECPNCGTWVDDRFCPSCGQRNAERLVSVRRILTDTLEDQLALNAALPRTLGALFFRPGLLTREYVAGRIARYLPPFRLYLVSSVVFFVALSGIADADRMWRDAGPAIREWEAKHPGERPKNIEVGLDTLVAPRWMRPLARRILRQQDKLNAMTALESLRVQMESFNRNAPRATFFLVPAFAGVLHLLYLRRRKMYVEHLVFALHVQSFAFLAAAAGLMVPYTVPWRNRVIALILLGYLLWAMKVAYGQGWPKTLLKYAAVVVCYGSILIGTIVALTVISLLTL
jgi:hypothetical protein